MYSRYQRRSRVRRSGAAYAATLTAILAVAGAHAAGAQTTASLAQIKAEFASQPRVAVPHNEFAPGVAPLLNRSRFLGRQDGQTQVSITVSLPLRNRAALDEYVRRIADPKDALYGKGLTSKQFRELYSPSHEDFDTVISYAKSQGLSVAEASPTRSLVLVRGSSRNVESAFNVKLDRYLLPTGSVVYTNNVAPTIPQGVASRILGVTGLNSIPSVNYHRKAAPKFQTDLQSLLNPSAIGSGPAGGLAPNDILAAYNLKTVPYKGEGQSLAVFQLDGYDMADVTKYTTQFNLGTPNITNILYNGFSGLPNAGTDGGFLEVILDIDMVLALAPKLDHLYVYEAKNSDALGLYQRIADDNLAPVVSVSWGLAESLVDNATRLAEAQVFTQMAAQRQSIFNSSGDGGAYADAGSQTTPTVSVSDPASQPHVTGVGGTTLTTTGIGGTFVSETVWKGTLADAPLNGGGSGGGKSVIWPKPDYQKSPTPVGESPDMRDVPDVALDADPATGYDIYVADGGGWSSSGGTSAATPIWAAFITLVNQQRANVGDSALGEANPPIYALARDPADYAAAFHDVTVGDNLIYSAKVGYDDATGWGSFNGLELLNRLATSDPASFGTLSGTVLDADGAPLAGATLHFVREDTGATIGTDLVTGVDGKYTKDLSSKLTYTVSATKAPFAGRIDAGINVVAGATTVHDFVLTVGHPFSAGLQMISAPYDFSLNDVSYPSLIGLTAPLTREQRLYSYQPSQLQYVSYPTFPADTLRPGEGYWVKFAADNFTHFQGTPVKTTAVFQKVLQTGWNQIGNPFLENTLLSSIAVYDVKGNLLSSTLPASKVVKLPWAYRQASNDYVQLTANAPLVPWVGYWIYSSTASVLVITPPGGLPPNPPPTQPGSARN
ncbi:MAG: protease pro-enzyme activation domain-containing protein [Capsulimonas sp.]|uniref:protease pro-enzyme activation domain-containing protein n=1 Tax=Capsulimonas sp. TaxID=2494211 RepID=UPI003264CEBA